MSGRYMRSFLETIRKYLVTTIIRTNLLRKSLSGLYESCLSHLAVAEAKDESYKNALQPQNDISVRLLSGIC